MRCTKLAVATLLVLCALGHVNYVQAQLDDDSGHISSESGVSPGAENDNNSNTGGDIVNNDISNDNNAGNSQTDNSEDGFLNDTGDIIEDSIASTGNANTSATTSTTQSSPSPSPSASANASGTTTSKPSASSKMISSTTSNKASSSPDPYHNGASVLMDRMPIQVLALSVVISVPMAMLL
ncbi:hypothetical protein IWQ61_000427 [Dispira simplex]|nr:hypothetical protein IWQ61_000427 [Dispira simplex]